MKKFAITNPAFMLLINITIGILIGNYFQFTFSILIALISTIIISSIILFKKQFYFSVKLLLGLSIGFIISYNTNSNFINIPNRIIPGSKAIINGEVIKILYENAKLQRILIDGNIDAKYFDRLDDRKIILNIFKSNRQINIQKGSYIYANAIIKFPKTKQFKDQFDEYKFLRSYNADFNAVAQDKKIALLNPPNWFNTFINNTVKSIDDRIEQLFDANSKAIIKAMVLGDKSSISSELKEVFSYSGTAHILAVSGLHTGIIGAIIFVLLGFVRNRIIKLIIFSFTILFFVLISGMQDSAIRASLLAIFVMFAYTFQLRYNLLNVLSSVVICLIIIEPFIIYSVGFQMSVVSVIGILIFYKPILDFFKLTVFPSDNIIISFIQKSVSVTLAASITISPLIAYYFGIFSLVSPLSNLLTIPLVTFSLIYAIISIIFSFISFPLALIFAETTNYLIYLMENINKWAIEIPFSYLEFDTIFPISLIISISIIYIIYSKYRTTIIFRATVCSVIILLSILLLKKQNEHQIQIFPREQYVAFYMPLKYNADFVLIADRKPSQSPRRDFDFENFLINNNRKMIIGYNGNSGINICDNLKKQRKIVQKEINLKQIEYLSNLLRLPKHLTQITDLKND